jgi:benzoyl-CoA reductase/2-hydroxyglutaryl-CoA dehydratase subunit BcrC/BadD/HgdB
VDVVKTFGRAVEYLADTRPGAARGLMRIGWQAMGAKFHYLPVKQLGQADRFLADMMMRNMLLPLRKPDRSAIVSIFVPCELLQEAGLNPYNVEAYSCYTAASEAGLGCIQAAEQAGAPETLCSFHRTFLGAAYRGILPAPRCIVYTSLLCDANLLTFRELARHYDVPSFAIDVPRSQTPASIEHVAGQLRDLKVFLEDVTGNSIDGDALRERTKRASRQLEALDTYMRLRADRFIPTDVVSPFYRTMTNNVLLGTEDVSRLMELQIDDAIAAPPKRGTHLYWMHAIPYYSDALEPLILHDDAQIVGCDLAQSVAPPTSTDDPYMAMAERLVFNIMNGNSSRRIDAGIANARACGADGVVWFNHWGCKHTMGISQMAKRRFEEAGLPFLLLDGDGCDHAHGGEGQMSTRLEAFLEMLEGRRA